MSEQADEWAALDELLGVEVVPVPNAGVDPLAFYGRCSTEDNQDPETSRAWQLDNARKFVEPLGGHVVAEYFDIGQSRSVPWERRSEAVQLLATLKNPDRGWTGLVVGEGEVLGNGVWACLDRILPIQSRSRGRVQATYSRWVCSRSQSLDSVVAANVGGPLRGRSGRRRRSRGLRRE